MLNKDIAVDLIDPPIYAVRCQIDDGALMELAEDIKKVGLIHPITVKPVNERYEIVAGHRRWLAHKLLAAATVRCQIILDGTVDTDIIKLHENYSREDIAPLDEALYFAALIDKHNFTQQQLALKIGRSTSYVAARLNLLTLDPLIMAPLQSGEISASVAAALGRCPNPQYIEYYIRQCIEQGANVRTVAAWMNHCPLPEPGSDGSPSSPPGDLPSAPAVVLPRWTCAVCHGSKAAHECLMVPVCVSCKGVLSTQA